MPEEIKYRKIEFSVDRNSFFESHKMNASEWLHKICKGKVGKKYYGNRFKEMGFGYEIDIITQQLNIFVYESKKDILYRRFDHLNTEKEKRKEIINRKFEIE